MSEQFVIVAGRDERPEIINRGRLEKGSGQTVIEGEMIKTLNRRADIGIPNRTEAWGVRLDTNGKVPESPLSVTDKLYSGQIKELKWGDPSGSIIVCRYLRGYNSIDQQYQDLVLNAASTIREDNEASMDAFYYVFQSGDNFYEPVKDRYLVQFLRVHYLNRSSIYRDPQTEDYLFWELDDKPTSETSETKMVDARREALNIVYDVSGSSKKLGVLLNIVAPIVDVMPSERDTYRTLQLTADEKSALFLEQIAKYRADVDDVFALAKSFDVVDVSKEGIIAAGAGVKKEVIGSEVPGKKEAMIEWVKENYLDEKAHEIFFRLKNITEKLKK